MFSTESHIPRYYKFSPGIIDFAEIFWVCVWLQWENWVIIISALENLRTVYGYYSVLNLTLSGHPGYIYSILEHLFELTWFRVVCPFSRIGKLSWLFYYSSCSGYYHLRSTFCTVNVKSSVLMIVIFSNTENGWSGQQK